MPNRVSPFRKPLVETLHQTFGRDGTNHPLFTALGIEEDAVRAIGGHRNARRQVGDQALSEEEFALLLTVPFAFTAEQIGPAFPDSFKQEILHIRRTQAAAFARTIPRHVRRDWHRTTTCRD